MDIVAIDMPNGGGAYFRKELMVVDKYSGDANEEEIRKSAICLLGHELGHIWFNGADSSSWEDWLNETGAEWAALCYIQYLITRSNNDEWLKELFEQELIRHREQAKGTPVIQPPLSGKRPPTGVHQRGVVLWFEIYKKYGIDTIITIMRTLAELPLKTTNIFMAALREKMGNEIPDIIQRGLTMSEYDGICEG